jgi:hypothetical protein
VLTFFGLTLDYRLNLFKQIHDIVFYGNGGYSWEVIYNMPIWLRNLTFNLIYKHNNPENEAEKSWTEGPAKEMAAKNKKLKFPVYNTNDNKGVKK